MSREVLALAMAQVGEFLALLLLVSGVRKWLWRERVVRAVHSLTEVPDGFAWVLALFASVGEVGGGVLMAMPATRQWGASIAIALWSVYLVLIYRAIVHGRRALDCDCSFSASRHLLGWFEVARNAVLIGFAVAVLCAADPAADILDPRALLAAVALMVIYVSLDVAMNLDLRPAAGST
ncbi:MAG: MauE/DoxX family redox-associated membrane protein [Gammaproteobacteria bacterium]